MAVNFIKEIEVITASLETPAGNVVGKLVYLQSKGELDHLKSTENDTSREYPPI